MITALAKTFYDSFTAGNNFDTIFIRLS